MSSSMQQKRIGFIGGGNMARAMIHGLLAMGHAADCLAVSNPHQEKLIHFRDELGIHATTDNKALAIDCDVIVLSVKPQKIIDVAKEIQPVLATHQALVISVAAGVSCDRLQNALGDAVHLCRAMPNLPAMVQSAATGLFATKAILDTEYDLAEQIMRAIGMVVWVDSEDKLDIVTALSGSGPAYLFYMMEALSEAAVELGLDEAQAMLLTKQTFLGAAHIAMQTEMPIDLLRQNVTSPGGTTEAGLAALSDNQATQTIKAAVKAAYERAKILEGQS
jgi:pyrroline-5-carboxylate reductase